MIHLAVSAPLGPAQGQNSSLWLQVRAACCVSQDTRNSVSRHHQYLVVHKDSQLGGVQFHGPCNSVFPQHPSDPCHAFWPATSCSAQEGPEQLLRDEHPPGLIFLRVSDMVKGPYSTVPSLFLLYTPLTPKAPFWAHRMGSAPAVFLLSCPVLQLVALLSLSLPSSEALLSEHGSLTCTNCNCLLQLCSARLVCARFIAFITYASHGVHYTTANSACTLSLR